MLAFDASYMRDLTVIKNTNRVYVYLLVSVCIRTASRAWHISYICWEVSHSFRILRPRQNGRHFADDTSKRIFVNENVRILIEISLKFVSKGPIKNIPSLV